MEYIDETKTISEDIMDRAELVAKDPVLIIYSTMLSLVKDQDEFSWRILRAQEEVRPFMEKSIGCMFKMDIAGTYAALIAQASHMIAAVPLSVVRDEHVANVARYRSKEIQLLVDAAAVSNERFLTEAGHILLAALREVFGDLVATEVSPAAQAIYDNEMSLARQIVEEGVSTMHPAAKEAN